MYYEINVSKNGKHYFATAERSLTTKMEAEAAWKHFSRLFPENHGYKLSMTHKQSSGKDMTEEFNLNCGINDFVYELYGREKETGKSIHVGDYKSNTKPTEIKSELHNVECCLGMDGLENVTDFVPTISALNCIKKKSNIVDLEWFLYGLNV